MEGLFFARISITVSINIQKTQLLFPTSIGAADFPFPVTMQKCCAFAKRQGMLPVEFLLVLFAGEAQPGRGMLQKNAKSPRTSKAQQAASATVPQAEIIFTPPAIHFAAPFGNSEICYEFLRRLYDPRKICLKEFFYVALLNNANQCIGYSQIGVGTDQGVLVNVREIFQLAILSNATGVIISHNHPSGTLKPSKNDIALTQSINEGLKHFDIKLLDHIIITHEGYVSLTDEGLF